MSNSEFVEIVPEASRIMEGLRDTGYEFNTAVADIVDNSIAANATIVKIKVAQRIDDSIRVSIADNGSGMTREELKSAMRYGAPERADKHSLGKFGLGLKTASTSCCRRLKVGSIKPGGAPGVCAVWDLDDIAASNKGWILRLDPLSGSDEKELKACCGDLGTGTIVVWEKCDRLLSHRYSNPSTSAFKKALDNAVESLAFHLSMTFHRFLDESDGRARNVSIAVNGELLQPWDPFCREIKDDYGSNTFLVNHDGLDSSVTAVAYIVPQKEDMPSLEAQQRIMPSYKNKALKSFSEESMSGFYVYRENRLIHYGDWFGMPGVDFHNKLCRFELSFDAELDELFQVDIKKSRILLNDDLKNELLKWASPFKKQGEKLYRGSQTKASKKQSGNIHDTSNNTIVSNESSLVDPNVVVAVGPNEAKITNKFGITVTPYTIHEGVGNGDVAIETVDELEDGQLWAPALIDKHPGVQLSAKHEFYKRFYASNKHSESAILAMDYLFYALSQAENDALGEEAQENLLEARFVASRLLRKLAKFLPDVSIEDIEAGSEDA